MATGKKVIIWTGVLLFLGLIAFQTWTVVEQDRSGALEQGSEANRAGPSAFMAGKAGRLPLTPPDELAGLALTDSITGDEALIEIAKMHGKGFPLLDGYVAQYGNDQDQVTVWVGRAKDSIAAQSLLVQMTERLREGNSPFSHLQQLTVGDEVVYSLVGLGQQHYYYQVADKVVWLAVRGGLNPLEVLHQALKEIN
ncbi:MAG: hypothetical protein ACE5NP_06430 [Anaerolineae bacterium]